jgi:hypothetical protein
MTILIGAFGGLLVGLTSVGSGSIIIVSLMLVYPQLRGSQLVGTDLVQAVPLVGAAALTYVFIGEFELGLTTSILLGSVPAVYLGSRLSSKAPDGLIRPALVVVLIASALKLFDVPSLMVGVILLGLILVGFPLWGAIDSGRYPVSAWDRVGFHRPRWSKWQLLGAPVGIGFPVAIAYFARVRPLLVAETGTVSVQEVPTPATAKRA